MRTLLINSMFVNRFYRRCADELGALPGMELSIFMPENWRMNGSVLPLDPPKVESPYSIRTGRAAWKGFENRGFYLAGLVQAFRESKPEVLYLMEEPFSFFTLQVMNVRRMLFPKTPVVFFTWNNLSLSRFDYRPSVVYRSIGAWALPQFARAVTANSEAIEVLRSAGFDRPARAIGYGVDTEAFADDASDCSELRHQLDISSGDRVIGFLGRIKWMKGLDLLVEAFAELLTRGEQQLKLLIIGAGEYDAELDQLIAKLDIVQHVRRLPNVPQAEVPKYMRLMDIHVLPSRREGMWAEQFGRVIIEAMASRTIVVGSSSGAIPEVIGDAGFVFQENDAKDLSNNLWRALHLNPAQREVLLDKGSLRATTVFSWRTFAERSMEELSAAHADWGVHRV